MLWPPDSHCPTGSFRRCPRSKNNWKSGRLTYWLMQNYYLYPCVLLLSWRSIQICRIISHQPCWWRRSCVLQHSRVYGLSRWCVSTLEVFLEPSLGGKIASSTHSAEGRSFGSVGFFSAVVVFEHFVLNCGHQQISAAWSCTRRMREIVAGSLQKWWCRLSDWTEWMASAPVVRWVWSFRNAPKSRRARLGGECELATGQLSGESKFEWMRMVA